MNDTHTPQPTGAATLTVLAGHRKSGRCGACGRSVIWLTSSPHGKSVPFDRDPLVLRTIENDRGLRFQVVSRDAIHFASCRARQRQPRIPNADVRHATGTGGRS